MRAIRVHAFGGPEQLSVEHVEDPRAGASGLLVEMHAAGVNPVDAYVRAGAHQVRPPLPYTPGFDGAGIVIEAGADVQRVRPGDRVYVAGTRTGTYAERVACDELHVYPLPGALTFAQGAAIGIPYTTAFRALTDVARARRGESVLVHGASGAVGLAAVQLARAAGAVVIGTAGSDEGKELVKAQGAAAVFGHEGPALEQGVRELTNGRGVDVILEMLANHNLGRDLPLLAMRGRVVVVGSRGSVEINPRDLMTRDAAVHGVSFFNLPPHDLRAAQEALGAAFELGHARPVVGEQFSLTDARRAHERLFESGARGKVVLTVAH